MIDPRWRTVVNVAPYIVLGVLIAFTFGFDWGDWPRLVVTLALCVAYGVCILVMHTLPTSWRDRPAAIAVFMTVLIALNLVLVLIDGWFGFLTIATFLFAYTTTDWPWELLAVGSTAIVAGIAQSSGISSGVWTIPLTLLIIVLNIVVMCGLSWGLQLSQAQQTKAITGEERARMAREIHDTLAQRFAGIVTQLQAAEQARDDDDRTRHTDAALALARDGLTEARRSVQGLRPTDLDTARLAEALRNVAASWAARTAIRVDVKISGDARLLPTEAEVALLRTAQEALANVERHAHARRVVLTLRTDGHGTRLEVRDDGQGFDPVVVAEHPSHPDEGGYGLVAMRERVESVEGRFVVESHPGRGTAVRAEVPA